MIRNSIYFLLNFSVSKLGGTLCSNVSVTKSHPALWTNTGQETRDGRIYSESFLKWNNLRADYVDTYSCCRLSLSIILWMQISMVAILRPWHLSCILDRRKLLDEWMHLQKLTIKNCLTDKTKINSKLQKNRHLYCVLSTNNRSYLTPYLICNADTASQTSVNRAYKLPLELIKPVRREYSRLVSQTQKLGVAPPELWRPEADPRSHEGYELACLFLR